MLSFRFRRSGPCAQLPVPVFKCRLRPVPMVRSLNYDLCPASGAQPPILVSRSPCSGPSAQLPVHVPVLSFRCTGPCLGFDVQLPALRSQPPAPVFKFRCLGPSSPLPVLVFTSGIIIWLRYSGPGSQVLLLNFRFWNSVPGGQLPVLEFSSRRSGLSSYVRFYHEFGVPGLGSSLRLSCLFPQPVQIILMVGSA